MAFIESHVTLFNKGRRTFQNIYKNTSLHPDKSTEIPSKLAEQLVKHYPRELMIIGKPFSVEPQKLTTSNSPNKPSPNKPSSNRPVSGAKHGNKE